jgi:hypothetical protein
MGYVAGYIVLAGFLAWFCLVMDAREEREEAERAEASQVDNDSA